MTRTSGRRHPKTLRYRSIADAALRRLGGQLSLRMNRTTRGNRPGGSMTALPPRRRWAPPLPIAARQTPAPPQRGQSSLKSGRTTHLAPVPTCHWRGYTSKPPSLDGRSGRIFRGSGRLFLACAVNRPKGQRSDAPTRVTARPHGTSSAWPAPRNGDPRSVAR